MVEQYGPIDYAKLAEKLRGEMVKAFPRTQTFSFENLDVLEANNLVKHGASPPDYRKDKLFVFLGPAGRIYSMDEEGNWVQEYLHPYEATPSPATPKIRWRATCWSGLSTVNGLFFCGMLLGYTPPNGVLRLNPDTLNWEAKLGGTTEFMAMEVYKGNLYLADWAGEIWRLPNTNINLSFVRDYVLPTGLHATCVKRFSVDDSLYFGEAADHAYETLARRDINLYSFNLSTGIWGVAHTFRNEMGITALEEYRGRLYIGMNSGAVYSYDGSTYRKEAELGLIPIMRMVRVGKILLICQGSRLGGGALWATDGAQYWKVFDSPLAISDVEEFFGRIYVSTCWSKENLTSSTAHVIGINASELSTRRLHPQTQYFRDDDLNVEWNNLAISAGDTTFPVACLGYDVYLEFLSSVGGTLTIEEDMVGDGDWRTYATETIAANTPKVIPLTGKMAFIRLSYNTASTVRAKVTLVPNNG